MYVITSSTYYTFKGHGTWLFHVSGTLRDKITHWSVTGSDVIRLSLRAFSGRFFVEQSDLQPITVQHKAYETAEQTAAGQGTEDGGRGQMASFNHSFTRLVRRLIPHHLVNVCVLTQGHLTCHICSKSKTNPEPVCAVVTVFSVLCLYLRISPPEHWSWDQRVWESARLLSGFVVFVDRTKSKSIKTLFVIPRHPSVVWREMFSLPPPP